jgi:hypothetical protein
MFRRFRRPVVHLLVAAQLLLSAPMANAFDLLAQGEAVPCMERMAAVSDGPDCPCCPDGSQSLAGCLSTCLAAAAITPTILASTALSGHPETCRTQVTAAFRSAEPPLKPPPIA